LYGVIVAFEDNMFKVKTDFGFVLVEKDKIASIIPTTPSAKTDAQPATKKAAPQPEKTTPATEAAVASGSAAAAEPANASAKPEAVESAKREKPAPKIGNTPVKPELPAKASVTNDAAPAIKDPAAPPATLTASAPPPAPPKEESPAIREEVQGNLY